MYKIKVMIVDDSALVRKTLSDIVEKSAGMELVATAQDPIFAQRKIAKLGWPDVLLLDIEMPRMDGITFLKTIMEDNPVPVIIISSVAPEGSKNAIDALRLGAVEVLEKPKYEVRDFLESYSAKLVRIIRSVSTQRVKRAKESIEVYQKHTADVIMSKPSVKNIPTTNKIIAIGSSTGGVQVIENIVVSLTKKSSPILITQHMPATFTNSLAKRLDSISEVKVQEAVDGTKIEIGNVYIAPGSHHMMVKRLGSIYNIVIKDGPRISGHKPSVDILFRSFASEVGKNAVGIILTGMGDDGAHGLKEMRDMGAITYAQNESSCVVYGMPRVATEIGASQKSLSPLQIIDSLKRFRG
jgi:two-component system, chemotaxis family, protein-glutamate methylesterase/glutaminase